MNFTYPYRTSKLAAYDVIEAAQDYPGRELDLYYADRLSDALIKGAEYYGCSTIQWRLEDGTYIYVGPDMQESY